MSPELIFEVLGLKNVCVVVTNRFDIIRQLEWNIQSLSKIPDVYSEMRLMENLNAEATFIANILHANLFQRVGHNLEVSRSCLYATYGLLNRIQINWFRPPTSPPMWQSRGGGERG